jgi:hypothetical protein
VTYPGDPLAGLDPTDEERLAFLEALDEAEAEEAGLPDPYGGDSGPWDDFGAATAQMDAAHQLDGQRLAEDITDGLERRPSTEDRLTSAMRRIEAGTYTEPADPWGNMFELSERIS